MNTKLPSIDLTVFIHLVTAAFPEIDSAVKY